MALSLNKLKRLSDAGLVEFFEEELLLSAAGARAGVALWVTGCHMAVVSL